MTGVGFLTLMRLAELRVLRLEGIVFVLKSGVHVYGNALTLPAKGESIALLLHVDWRKASQAKDVWVPLACPRLMGRVLAQARKCRASGSAFLFPARDRKKGWPMSTTNPIGRAQFQKDMQRGLVEHCGFGSAARLLTAHALRVGGSNYMRRLGISDEVHRKLGGWMSIASSHGYMVLTPKEQAVVCKKMALVPNRSSAFALEEAGGLLEQIASLVL